MDHHLVEEALVEQEPFKGSQREVRNKDWSKVVALASLETIWPREFPPCNSPSSSFQVRTRPRASSTVSTILLTKTMKSTRLLTWPQMAVSILQRMVPIKVATGRVKVARWQVTAHIRNFHRIRP